MMLSNMHSIRKRIITIILLICCATLGAGFLINAVKDIRRIKTNLADQAAIAAKLVGNNCVSALTFNYPETASKNLKLLETFPGIVNAWLFDETGKVFAVYDDTDTGRPVSKDDVVDSYVFKDEYLYLQEPLNYQGKLYGYISLKISPEIERELYQRGTVALAVFVLLILVAYFLANLAQKIISVPILDLAKTSEKISKKSDYGIRLQSEAKGEIGTLYNSFNKMLDTIQRREQERNLAQNDLLFKEQVIESSTGAVITTDLLGVVTYCNPAFVKMFGYMAIGDIVGNSFSVFLEKQDDFNTILVSLTNYRNSILETKARGNNGSFFDAIFSADTIFDKNGTPESFVITVSDIRELRTITRKLETENNLRTIIQRVSDKLRGVQEIKELGNRLLSGLSAHIQFQIGALYIFDDDNSLSLAGGYSVLENQEFASGFIPGEGLASQAALEKRTLQIADIPKDYFTIRSGSGQALPKHILVIPFIFNNEVKGVLELGAFVEFTLLDLEILERLNETVAIAIHTSQSNERLQQLLEKTQSQSEELLSQTEEMHSQQEELEQTNEDLEQQTKLLKAQQIDIKKKNRDLKASSLLVEQKAKDLEIISQYKSEFMANMSHELRTPLNSILLLSDVLAENNENTLSKKQITFAQNIHSSGSELLALINGILDLAKVESGQMELFLEEVEIQDLKMDMERTFEPLALEKGLDFSISLDRKLPEKIITDKLKTEQILKNLMSNAIKFTSSGSVSLTIYLPGKDDTTLPEGMASDKTIAFAVTDTGIGIPKEKIDIIFEAFKQGDGTTSRKYGGTGLGLSISKEIAKTLRGTIELTSEPDTGSTFTLYLPCSIEKKLFAAEGDDPQPGAKSRALKTGTVESATVPEAFAKGPSSTNDDRDTITSEDKSVLVIEDDPSFAKILYDHAHDNNFKVIVADNGESGLHLADFYRPSAIILDLGLPGIDGWSVMERLKSNLKTKYIPVHIISAAQIQKKAMKMGAVGFISKPISLKNLKQVFIKFKEIISRSISRVLVIEESEEQCQSIKNIIGSNDVEVTCSYSTKEAEELLRKDNFDCLILDLNLSGVSGFDLLSIIEKDKQLCTIPVIVYTNEPLNEKEEEYLQKYTQNIILKSVNSPEQLLDETSLFLHRVEATLSDSNLKTLKQLYEKESVLKGKKILLVDDDMRNVFALNDILEEKGMVIKVATTGVEALTRLEEHPDIDMVLMDIMMPEMNGYEAMREIRKQQAFKKLPIIALTAKAMEGDRAKCIDAGANDYLSKPVDRKKLLSMIRVWLY